MNTKQIDERDIESEHCFVGEYLKGGHRVSLLSKSENGCWHSLVYVRILIRPPIFFQRGPEFKLDFTITWRVVIKSRLYPHTGSTRVPSTFPMSKSSVRKMLHQLGEHFYLPLHFSRWSWNAKASSPSVRSAYSHGTLAPLYNNGRKVVTRAIGSRVVRSVVRSCLRTCSKYKYGPCRLKIQNCARLNKQPLALFLNLTLQEPDNCNFFPTNLP